MFGKRPSKVQHSSIPKHHFSVSRLFAWMPFWGTNLPPRHLFGEAATRRSTRRPSRIAKGLRTRCSKPARARIAKGGGLFDRRSKNFEVSIVSFESSEPTLQPSMAERAIDTATDVSRTASEISTGLRAAVERLSRAIETAKQPGRPLSTISAITREAPLASLFVAFLLGIAVARRR
jgi:hypothetical protein